MSYQIFNEDCLEGMKRLADDSIDMILTDLPYNLTSCKWDFAPIDLAAMWEQFKRILKPCCAVVLFAGGKFTHKLVSSNLDWYKYKWIWIKNMPTFFVHAKNAPMHKFEEILVFSDGSVNHANLTNHRMKYNPQGLVATRTFKKLDGGLKADGEVKRSQIRGKGLVSKNVDRTNSIIGNSPCRARGTTYLQQSTGYPSDVLHFNTPHNVAKLHPTQKPVDLLEFLIRTYTDEGETVLDATIGSGSTGVAAVNTGRNFVGFELEEKFFDIAQNRIQKAVNENLQKLF